MLRVFFVAISILCMSLGGCADIRAQLSSMLQNSPPPPQAWGVGRSEIRSLEERSSYYREYTPWRVVKGRLQAPPPLRRASLPLVSPEATGSNLVPGQPPDDPEALRLWLEQRREQANQAHAAQMARFEEIDKRAMHSICAGSEHPLWHSSPPC